MEKYNGLSKNEVEYNQKLYGLNEFGKEKKLNFFKVFIAEFCDWLVIILIMAALISLIVDHESLFETFIIIFILIVNALVGSIQEIKSYKTLEGLKKLSNHKVKVIRDNQIKEIEPKYLTISDIVILKKGDLVDCDMLILEGQDLHFDESILTGESKEIHKHKGDNIYSGTLITNGEGIGKVIKIGLNSKIGQIAKKLKEHKDGLTPLEEKLQQIGKVIGIIAILICIIVFTIELILKIQLLEAFKSAVSLAVAAIPEGLATVVTITLAIGVGKMAKENAIVKKLSCVETLGCSNIICTDKTGTITENKEKIVAIFYKKIYSKNEIREIDDYILNVLSLSILKDSDEALNLAIKDFLSKYEINYEYSTILDYRPFNSKDKYSFIEVIYNGDKIKIYKGAYEKLIEIFSFKEGFELKKSYNEFLDKGYRTVAVAVDDEIIALIGLIDTPKEEVISSIMLANTANVKTIMITGDHKKTAFYIANKVNICQSIDEVINKDEFDKLTEEELYQNLERYKVYSRMEPNDKVRIIKAWQKKGAVVAMIGDGINDALALKVADIGCAMGSGAEISKDSSDIILVDSNYKTIVTAIKEGRSIYDNIKKTVMYLLSSNIGEVLSILIVLLLSIIFKINMGIPLLSIHLLWVNLITDSLPAFGLGMIKADDNIMKDKPRNKKDNFFDKKMIKDILFFGTIIGMLTIISYLIGVNLNSDNASTMAFLTISSTQLFHAYNCSSKESIFNKQTLKNKFLNLSFLIGMFLQISVVYFDGINDLFKLKPLSYLELSISLSLSIIIVIIAEIKKRIEKTSKRI